MARGDPGVLEISYPTSELEISTHKHCNYCGDKNSHILQTIGDHVLRFLFHVLLKLPPAFVPAREWDVWHRLREELAKRLPE